MIRYDSNWERKLHETVMQAYKYHPKRIKYSVPKSFHTYQPDWEITVGTRTVYVEAKGRFRDRDEYTKYLHIRESLKGKEELVFLFANAYVPMPGSKRRKDGTRRTHKEWAEKNGFRWFTAQTIYKVVEEAI